MQVCCSTKCVNDDNALDQNYAHHLYDYFETHPNASDSDFDGTETGDIESESDCTEKANTKTVLILWILTICERLYTTKMEEIDINIDHSH